MVHNERYRTMIIEFFKEHRKYGGSAKDIVKFIKNKPVRVGTTNKRPRRLVPRVSQICQLLRGMGGKIVRKERNEAIWVLDPKKLRGNRS